MGYEAHSFVQSAGDPEVVYLMRPLVEVDPGSDHWPPYIVNAANDLLAEVAKRFYGKSLAKCTRAELTDIARTALVTWLSSPEQE